VAVNSIQIWGLRSNFAPVDRPMRGDLTDHPRDYARQSRPTASDKERNRPTSSHPVNGRCLQIARSRPSLKLVVILGCRIISSNPLKYTSKQVQMREHRLRQFGARAPLSLFVKSLKKSNLRLHKNSKKIMDMYPVIYPTIV
jgi:hypothetical protein